jgi:D-3-phosphoglycerate dehydrogenase
MHHLGMDQVNVVNAIHLAKQRGIQMITEKSRLSKDFANAISVTLRSREESRQVAGTLLTGYGPRIIQVDKYTVDVVPEGNLILVAHQDKPGMIGNVGTFLGRHDVNIATMQVSRQLAGGAAIMLLTVDKEVEPDVLRAFVSETDILAADKITLL